MKRVTAFVGSARKKFTYDAVRQFELNLTRGTAEDAPLASINIGASVSLWG